MSIESSRHLSVVRSARDMLEGARRRVLEELPESDREQAGAYLAELTAAISDLLGDPQARDGVPGAVLDDRLFAVAATALEIQLLEAADDVTAPAVVKVLRAIAALRGAASGAAGAADPEDLRTRLRAADAFELVVEVAHDFRSPLTSILFLAETLRDGHSGEVSELQRSQLGLMYSAAFGLASVASNVVDLARREKDLIDDETELYSVAEVFDGVRRLVSPIVEEKGLELLIAVPDPARARGHPQALTRVLLNLTTNALKFTDEGRVELGASWLPHSRLEFYVQDTGRGIPPERHPEIFQPFKRRLGSGQEGHFFSGSGVGLSIARRLVGAMGSELVLATSDEAGTRFSFTVTSARTRA